MGVDVSNATVMVIEDAHRLGLAQLHQLRGRVGRGRKASYCFLLGDKKAEEKFRLLERSRDGFELAEEDLRQRGMGDLLGLRQSGENLEGLIDQELSGGGAPIDGEELDDGEGGAEEDGEEEASLEASEEEELAMTKEWFVGFDWNVKKAWRRSTENYDAGKRTLREMLDLDQMSFENETVFGTWPDGCKGVITDVSKDELAEMKK